MIYLLLGATNLTHEDGKLIFQVIMILVTMEMMIMVKDDDDGDVVDEQMNWKNTPPFQMFVFN